jgi:FkbM family methyltransferase
MTTGTALTRNPYRHAGRFPAAGYPLLLSHRKGWLPAPQGSAEVRLRDGRRLVCDLSDLTQRTMAAGLFEPAETRLIASLLGPGGVFVDIGAHIGWFTTLASRQAGASGLVLAFEPHPVNAAALRVNLELNGARNVRLAETALGGEQGELTLAGSDSGSFTGVNWGPYPRVAVPMTTLDHALADVPAITLLKMDVEGWEAHVLRGGRETLRRLESVLFEVNEPALLKAGSSRWELYGLLRGAGFTVLTPVAQRGVRRLIADGRVFNVLASR